GPSGSPFVTAISASRAAVRARSAATRQNALSVGLSASIRDKTAFAISTGESFLARTRWLSSRADCQISIDDSIVSSCVVKIFDRLGNPVSELAWAGDGSLESARVRLPDGSWLSVEPRATTAPPWGLSDRLWRAERFPEPGGWAGERLTVFEALDWARIDRIPSLAEPARLPPGGGTAVLNLIAELAREQGAARLAYPGPYPTEQLFLALLESFRYEPADAQDPLAAFMAGELVWTPAPHQRPLAPAIEDVARAIALEWGAVTRDLILVEGDRIRVSESFRRALAETLAAAGGRGPRATAALTAVVELAGLLGDELRARAQARLAALPPEAQARALDALGTPPPADGRHARAIADAIEALLSDVGA